MNAVTKRTVILKDTGEPSNHVNGGYEWVELIEEHGWAELSSWGSEGWDLGQWPYVMVAATRTAAASGPCSASPRLQGRVSGISLS
jgi:hypothetical protein